MTMVIKRTRRRRGLLRNCLNKLLTFRLVILRILLSWLLIIIVVKIIIITMLIWIILVFLIWLIIWTCRKILSICWWIFLRRLRCSSRKFSCRRKFRIKLFRIRIIISKYINYIFILYYFYYFIYNKARVFSV